MVGVVLCGWLIRVVLSLLFVFVVRCVWCFFSVVC